MQKTKKSRSGTSRSFYSRAARLTAILLAVLIALPLAADVVTMKSGAIITGKILNQSKEAIRIRTEAGEQVISKSDIIRIIYRDEEAEKRRLDQLKALEEMRLQQEALKKEQAEQKASEAKKLEEARKLADEKRQADKQAADQKDKQSSPAKPVKWKAMLFSALLPGTGQLYEGRGERGSYIIASFLTSAALTYRLNRDYHRFQNNLDSTLSRDFLITPVGARATGLPIDQTTGAVLVLHATENIDHLKTMRTRFGLATILSGSLMTGIYAWSLWDTRRGLAGAQPVVAVTPDGSLFFAMTLVTF